MALAPSLQAEGDKEANAREVWRPGKGGIADDYEYVMCVRCFCCTPSHSEAEDRTGTARSSNLTRGQERMCAFASDRTAMSSSKRKHSTAYASFGGLLMALGGAYRHLRDLSVGNNVYLLVRKA